MASIGEVPLEVFPGESRQRDYDLGVFMDKSAVEISKA